MQYYKLWILGFLPLSDFYKHAVLSNTCMWLVVEDNI